MRRYKIPLSHDYISVKKKKLPFWERRIYKDAQDRQVLSVIFVLPVLSVVKNPPQNSSNFLLHDYMYAFRG